MSSLKNDALIVCLDLVLSPAGSEMAHAGKASLASVFSCQLVSSTQLRPEGDSTVSEKMVLFIFQFRDPGRSHVACMNAVFCLSSK